MSEPCLGIDLGTTNSAVATVVDGKPRIIERRTGHRLLPSMVGFTPQDERVVGEAARDLAATYPENVAYATKRFMGLRWSSDLASRMRNVLPFPVVGGPSDDVRVRIAGRALPVVQVAAMLLGELRLDAEAFFQRPVRRAVITVPANFNDAQRQATQDAARLAGIEVLRLLNEPTAAALAYGLTTGFEGRAIVLDLGGGTFDVSLLEVTQGVFEVVGTGGDPFLGGEDFDQLIVRWLLEQIADPGLRERAAHDRGALQRLKAVAEQLKCALSTIEEAPFATEIFPDSKDGGSKLEGTLTRGVFEQLAEPLVSRCVDIVNQTLADSKATPESVNAVLLVGGMTRIPLVRRRLSERFGREPASGVSPDEAVALGAAVHAHELGRHSANVILLDIVGSTLSVGITGGACKPLIRKSTQLPCNATEIFHPSRNGQTVVRIPVYQGESLSARENFLLGQLTLGGLRPAQRGETPISVTFEMGTDGVLSVRAADTVTGRAESAFIVARTDLRNSERERIAKAEDEHLMTASKVDDDVRRRNVEVRNQLHEAIARVRAIHHDLVAAAAEAPLPAARQVVETVGQQLVEAEEIERQGSLEKAEATARLLADLERSLIGEAGLQRP